MDQTLKQRLVGALVLLSAAVIFLPLILDGRDNDESYSDIQIPNEPVVKLDLNEPKMDTAHFEAVKQQVDAQRDEIEPTEDQLNEPVQTVVAPKPPKQAAKEIIASEKASAKSVVSKPAPKAEPKADAPKPKPQPQLKDAYTVQLAAFSAKENANKLHKKLIDKSYNAYVQKGTSNGKTLYRVFVGPQVRENRAKIIANALQKEFKLKGMVVRYAP